MPQLNPLYFEPQLVWLAISFLVLYLLMAYGALPRVGGVIQRRQHQIDADLDRAAKLRAEIDAVVQAYERALAEARAQAAHTVGETRDQLAKVAAERQSASGAALAQRVKEAEQRIAMAKATALGDLRGVALDAARAATARLIGTAPDEAKLGGAVDAALAAVGGSDL
jgi:F-type H+-transporting ATPase subunit b